MTLHWLLHTRDLVRLKRDSWIVPKRKPEPALVWKLWRFGSLEWVGWWGCVVGTTGSLGSFGRGVCLCQLAAIAPGLPGALKGLSSLLVHNYIVDTLV